MPSDDLRCRVCGWLQSAAPWGLDGKTPSFEICDRCGVEFGYEDCTDAAVQQYRASWIAAGTPWHDKTKGRTNVQTEPTMSSRPTFDELRRFSQEYRALSALFALFWDPNGKTDEAITAKAMQEYEASWFKQVVVDGRRFLEQHELPLCLISSGANRWLPTEAEERQWLQALLDRIQAELEARRALQNSMP